MNVYIIVWRQYSWKLYISRKGACTLWKCLHTQKSCLHEVPLRFQQYEININLGRSSFRPFITRKKTLMRHASNFEFTTLTWSSFTALYVIHFFMKVSEMSCAFINALIKTLFSLFFQQFGLQALSLFFRKREAELNEQRFACGWTSIYILLRCAIN